INASLYEHIDGMISMAPAPNTHSNTSQPAKGYSISYSFQVPSQGAAAAIQRRMAELRSGTKAERDSGDYSPGKKAVAAAQALFALPTSGSAQPLPVVQEPALP